MSLSVGIVGLPNAGKSTLFNALASRRLAETAPRPFTTIEPHEAVVAVPDSDLEKLSGLMKPEATVPASVTFIDIAGLVKGAHEGEGLGNQFLGKIREVDAIVHVARAFADPYVTHAHPTHEPGTLEQIVEDIEIVNLELQLAGIIGKHSIYVLNFSERDLKDSKVQDYLTSVENKFGDKAIAIAAKLEEEMMDLSEEERKALLKAMDISESGLEKLIKASYKLLDLISFYTIKGGKELHAWSIKNGSSAIEAAGVVHTDFAKGFIKAEVVSVGELLEAGGWSEAKEKGKIRLEGRDYKVQDRDTIEFKTSN
jgi:ribosome-binding ATPase YchF (GTP1/OBG family)